MISLVLTTYNGEKYIEEQLESIRRQTLSPDEVIIRDDGSSDRTVEIVTTYISKYDLKTWKFIHGQENAGWKRNFYEVIVLAQGDYILLCDQDDIWHEDKIKSVVAVMESRPEIELLVSGFHSFYEEGANHLSNHGDLKNDGSVEQICFDKFCLNIRYPGCAFCFTRSLQSRFRQYWFEASPHDAMLWYLAIQNDSLFVYNKVLMEYRRHRESATDHVGHYTVEKQLEICKRHIRVIEMLIGMNSGRNLERVKLLMQMKNWYSCRIRMLEDRSLIWALKVIPQLKYYQKVKHYLIDVKLMIFG